MYRMIVVACLVVGFTTEGYSAKLTGHGMGHGAGHEMEHDMGEGFGRMGKGVPMQTRSCAVANIAVHPNFDLQQYVGTWFTVSHAEGSAYPFHRRSHYSLQENGLLRMATQRILQQDGCETTMQFEADAYTPEGATENSKLLLQPRGFDVPPEDYWVVYTDYVDHALVYSCSETSEDGSCVEGANHAWFLSRRGTLTGEARDHMISLLPALCVDAERMVNVPTDCDAALGVPSPAPETSHSHDAVPSSSSCDVSGFQAMTGFDKTQYVGTWYVIAHLQAGVYPYHRISHYTLDEEESLTMVTHRISSPNDCSAAWKFKGQAYIPESSELDSKLVLKPFGMPVYGEDYWVIYTDYLDHTLVYSCREQSEDGTCLEGAAHAWLLSRNPSLSSDARSHMEMLLTEMCVDTGSLVDTPHECDELLGPESLTVQGTANECIVHDFPIMQGFDKSRYVGTWFVVSHLQEGVYPYQRISNYSLENDGSLAMATDRITGPDSCSSAWHFEATATQLEDSTSSSKMLLRPRGMEVEGEDYWVMYTDYTDHALVYSCGVKNLDGTCQEDAKHAWLLSRKPKLSDIAHSHMVSILTELCIDPTQLIDTPAECDDSLGVSEVVECAVSNFPVMENFDPSQYIGTWYVVSHLQDDVYPYHRISNYALTEEGGLTMATNRISGPGECISAHSFEAEASVNEQAKVGSKLLLRPVGIPAEGEDYWVVYTDYTNHTLVYSCGAKKLDGTCQEGASHAYMMSRQAALSVEARDHMEMLLEGLCIDPAQMTPTPSDCDAVFETGLRRPVVEHRARVCLVDEIQVMENFDLNQYAGIWYTASQIQPREYPFHRVSNYTMQDNGRLMMSTDQFMRPGDCSTAHFDAEAFHAPTELEELNGKLILQPVDSAVPPGNYWVIHANYSDHALVYSCLRKNREGACRRGFSMVWFMSRNPTLTDEARASLTARLQDLCIKPSKLKDVATDCDAEIGITSEEEVRNPSPCAVANIQVKEDFVIEKFLGDWYDLSHTNDALHMNVPDLEIISFGRPPADSDADLSVTMKNIRLNGVCYHKNMPGSGWIGQNDPAKIVVSFPLIPDGFDVPEVVNHWVLDTDYTNYAVTYTCHRIKRDGSCDPASQGLWIRGRERYIPAEFWTTIQAVIKRSCVTPSSIQPNPAPCQDSVPEDRNQVDARSCMDTEFSCCLLSDEAAVDAEFSNCPRVAPPVAGRMIPEAPVSIVEGEVLCDPRINCKMFCRFGFLTNADGCEICECAVEPTIEISQPIGGACQIRYDVIMAKLKNNSPRVGFYVPDCDANGDYNILQCLYPHDACWCADAISGERVRKARYDGDAPSCDP